MGENDYLELYRHLRMRARASGREGLDERIMESRRLAEIRGSRDDVIAYILALRDEFMLGSSAAARQTMQRLMHVRSPEGRPISGVVVDIVEQDRSGYVQESFDLVGSPELDEAVATLEQLLEALNGDAQGGMA